MRRAIIVAAAVLAIAMGGHVSADEGPWDYDEIIVDVTLDHHWCPEGTFPATYEAARAEDPTQCGPDPCWGSVTMWRADPCGDTPAEDMRNPQPGLFGEPVTTSPPAPAEPSPAPQPVAARTPEPATVDNGAILRLISALTSLIPR